MCRVFHKNVGVKRSPLRDLTRIDSFLDHFLDDCPSLPPLMDFPSSSDRPAGSNFSHDEDELKGGATSSGKSSDFGNFPSYFSTNSNNYSKLQLQQDQNNFRLPTYNYALKTSYEASSSHPDPNSVFYPPISIPTASYPFSGFKVTPDHQANSSSHSAANQGILDPKRQCKIEQFSSNNSMVSPSQDTGISNDMAPEISSVVSKGNVENKSFEDLEGLSVDPNMSDLDSLWEYY